MKKHFYTGLVVILPLVITFYVFNWLLKIVIKLISGTTITKIIRWLLGIIYSGHSHEIEFKILTYLISVLIIFSFITFLGYTMKIVFFSKIMKKFVVLVEKIPVIKSVYTTAKQIIGILYSSEGEAAYKKVVAVEYPRKGMYAIGFMTAESNNAVKEAFQVGEIANVFIPTSPNPTSGMLICIPKEDIKILNIDTEAAFKLIISGGYVTEESVKKLQDIE
ncbi:DUF502 domain-containing protein [Fusobacterium gastrosuis]|uniref:DUF502 domain-containing protein n=1 Tax=Fusobacterium gastrosuis TaxID=1755100 RepID=UPI003F52FB2E